MEDENDIKMTTALLKKKNGSNLCLQCNSASCNKNLENISVKKKKAQGGGDTHENYCMLHISNA